MNKETIPIFFASDDNYIPFLSVAISSLLEHANKNYNYDIIVLSSNINEENMKKIKAYEKEGVKVIFEDVKSKIENIMDDLSLRLRDYYSLSIYYRLFIPSLFPNYKKAIYLDADIVVIDDIAKMYNEDLNGYLVASVNDDVIMSHEAFKEYSREMIGIEPEKYFNSGVLLMNLIEFRKDNIEEKFLHLLNKYNFDVICPDQDYLNFLCKDKVKYLDKGWDRMPIEDKDFDDKNLHIIHYNNFHKPWNYDNILYENIYWECAQKSNCYDEIIRMKGNYTKEDIKRDDEGFINLVNQSKRISSSGFTFKKMIGKDYFKSI